MTNAKKFSGILLLMGLLLCHTHSSAQKITVSKKYNQGFRLGFGLNGGIPKNNQFDWSLGADTRIQYDFTRKTSLTFTTGFTNLFIGESVKDLGFIPAKAGFKAFVWGNQFYVLGEAGAGFAVTNGYDKTTFLWAPGIGYANKYVDLSLRYEDYDKFNTAQLALRLAYGFKL